MNDAMNVMGILLAGGRGSRFAPDGSANKLLADIDGMPVCVATAQAFAQALPQFVAAVSPANAAVAEALRTAGHDAVVCDRATEGMGATLAQAVAAIVAARHARGLGAPAWCVMPADMPRMAPSTIRALVQAWAALPAPDRARAALAPVYRGERGHPVLMGPGWTDTLRALQGDAGARKQIAPSLVLVPVDDPGCLLDVDTPELLQAARELQRRD